MFNFTIKNQKPIHTKDLPIFSFKLLKNNNEEHIDFDTATKNICIFGGTGSGKTTTVCYPILYKLAKNNCSGLILDIKGGYSNFGRILNQKFTNKVEILGVYEHCQKINLIAGISPYKLREFLSEAVSSVIKDDNNYWGMNGIEDFVLIYEILLNHNKEILPTLADLYFLFNSSYELEKLVNATDYKLSKKITFRKKTDAFSIFNENKSETAGEQRTWQFSTILKFLKPFYEDPYIREFFCNSKALSFEQMIYEEKKIIILDLPSSKFGETSIFISQILRAMFKDTIKNKNESWLQSNGYGYHQFTFLLIDEYQQFINNNSSPSMDDNNWFDTSRGFGNINIICTQSLDSLISKTNLNYIEQLIGNCRNIIHLPTHAHNSLLHIGELASTQIMQNLKNQTEKSTAYIYIGQTQKRLSLSEEIILCASQDKMMNFFTSDDYKNASFKMENHLNKKIIHKEYIFPYSTHPIVDEYKNLWINCSKPKFKIDRNVHIITSKTKSSGFLDFNHIINEEEIIFKQVFVYSDIYMNELSINFIKGLDIQSGDMLLFIRGGGNLGNSFLSSSEYKKELNKLVKKQVIIGTGYGHVDDEIYKFKFVDIKGITPTDLAYKIAKNKTPINIKENHESKEEDSSIDDLKNQLDNLFSVSK